MTTSQSSAVPPAPAAKKKAGAGKWILRIFLALVVLIGVGLVALYFGRNPLVIAGVERGGQYATSQKTALTDANLALFQGALTLNGLNIANPQGYSDPNFLTMKSCSVTMEPGSVLSDTVVIDRIDIDGLNITLDQNGVKGSNLSDIMDAINKNTASTGNSSNSSPGKKLKIGEVSLTNIMVHIHAAPLPNLDLNLGNINIADPTNPDGRPMKIADLIGKILLHISENILNNPQIPGQLKDSLKDVSSILNNVQGDLQKELKGINLKDLPGLGTAPGGNPVQGLGKDLQNGGKGLQNLFNGGSNNKPQ